MADNPNEVCVIIPAWNAEATLERAVVSAMMQPEVLEIAIIDDASVDGTLSVARYLAERDSRVQIVAQSSNQGPAAARNLGIANTKSEFIALLDSDDFFLPGRFSKMLSVSDWDAIADNVAFVLEDRIGRFTENQIKKSKDPPHEISLSAFIRGNISSRSKYRGELGFAKPLLRRTFLRDAALSYDERLRLGEDYALYVRLIALGGRFLTMSDSGYVAVERRSSLSGIHDEDHLDALARSDLDLETSYLLSAAERGAVKAHRLHLEAKVHHRRFLTCKRAEGPLMALWFALREPRRFAGLASALISDKFGTAFERSEDIRYLF